MDEAAQRMGTRMSWKHLIIKCIHCLNIISLSGRRNFLDSFGSNLMRISKQLLERVLIYFITFGVMIQLHLLHHAIPGSHKLEKTLKNINIKGYTRVNYSKNSNC